MKLKLPIILLSLGLTLAAGFLCGRLTDAEVASAATQQSDPADFHDLRINPTGDYVGLIDPDHPDITRLARQLGTYENAYRFVSNEVRFAPFVPPGPVDKTLEHRTGSCLGKAALLASLYRAMGMPSDEVRLVVGLVSTPNGLADHVWVDLEHRGSCLQQDPSGLLGRFGFDEFPGNRYVDTYVVKENFCFNDRDFAVVSQLNRFRDGTTRH